MKFWHIVHIFIVTFLLAQEMFTGIYWVITSLMKIAALKVLFSLGLQMNAFLHFSQLMSDFRASFFL
jgi:hypothetical protein